ncbi:DUF4082 domain-containing protein [Nonomuraea lactucae]|uniref:DUF4082 domain-containing protein n=1 Tax=Nonomuraea lactucae TaxID=2249762 RepID=UPI001F05ED91|nr:DUF4082 domain-containing protein [Nonomuraea lactucae]
MENSKPGNPPSEWDILGAGSSAIQGYATQMSVNKGETVRFKVDTQATDYRLDIYRIGYYGGMGARKVATVQPSVPLPQQQPACLQETQTGLIDCGRWAVSASWAVPGDAVSGVYIAKLEREDGRSGASHIIFVVRDDTRGSDILVQTSDTTWQAYNRYGGNSLYFGSPAGRAYKVSYNRPFRTRGTTTSDAPETFFFSAEYPMVRWLEANGYDVSYFSGVDTVSRGQELLEHRTFLSVGHDEYWSNETRGSVETARDNGVNIAFFSGNEIFWKTRWESSIDSSATPFRTLVSYKETHANAKIDPSPQWTGTWRDPRFSPPSDGGRPENRVSGTFFMVNGPVNDAISVPGEYAPMRLWRNTSVAALQPGQTATFPAGTLAFEWDEAPDNDFTPPGTVRLSRTTVATPNKYLLDFGTTYGSGVATHSLTLYKAPSGALVFSAGTVQWSWGLDSTHDLPGTPTDVRMQQATVNLLADMRAQPASLQAGLVPATASTDTTPPVAAITSPAAGENVGTGTFVARGTATDAGGGVVAAVEVSTDGGAHWRQATGRGTWQFTWTIEGSGAKTLMVRAVDDSGNLQATPTSVTVNASCPCTLFPSSAVPAVHAADDPSSVEVGVKFQVATPGTITGIRFYKGPENTGTHIGNLWTSGGQLLARVTFTGETASGWQQAQFSTPVQVSPGTTYVASYFAPNGDYAQNTSFFTNALVSGPLTAPASGASGGNGVYRYTSGTAFPTNTFSASNYWVDVVFMPSGQPPVTNSLWSDTTIPAVESVNDAKAVTLGVKFRANTNGTVSGVRFYKGSLNTGTHTGSLWTSGGQQLASVTFTGETASGWQRMNFATPVAINANTTYVVTYHTTSGNYAVNRSYFTTPYANGPLVALASGTEGGNGLYRYSATNAFPTSSYQASNYWVDVIFTGGIG